VLSGFETLKVCTGYILDGKKLDYVPTETSDFERVEPVYKDVPGWSQDLRAARSLKDLPKEARDYLDFMEEFTGTPIAILSIGPDREETMILRPEQIWGQESRIPVSVV